MVGSRIKSWREFQTVDRQQKRPNGRKCWAGCEVLQVVDSWWNADGAKSQHRRLGRNCLTGMVVRGRSDIGEQSLWAWKTPGQGCRAIKVHHAVSDPDCSQTSEYRWRRSQPHSTHAVTCPLLFLVHRQEQCCSNQSVSSQRRRRV